MKGQIFLAGSTLAIQLFFPAAAFSNNANESSWASGRDGVADFCLSISNTVTGWTKLMSGDSRASQNEDNVWGTKHGGWDAPRSQTSPNQNIVIIEKRASIAKGSTGVVVNEGDGSRRTRTFQYYTGGLKKLVDGGATHSNFGSYGASVGSGSNAMGSGHGMGMMMNSGNTIHFAGSWGYSGPDSSSWGSSGGSRSGRAGSGGMGRSGVAASGGMTR